MSDVSEDGSDDKEYEYKKTPRIRKLFFSLSLSSEGIQEYENVQLNIPG